MTRSDPSSASSAPGWRRRARATPRRARCCSRRTARAGRGARARHVRRGDPRADRARLGGVVRRARRVGRAGHEPPRHRPPGRGRAGASTRSPGTRRRSRQLRAHARAARRRREARTASRSPSRGPWRCRSSSSTTRSSPPPTTACASAPSTRPRAPASTGATTAPRPRHLRRQGRRQERRERRRARPARRRGRGRADEGLVARAPGCAQGGPRGARLVPEVPAPAMEAGAGAS